MSNDLMPPVVCIMGPTASGKTALALALADRVPCEIISVDSALVYRGMDIGTAKPDALELQQVPHHLIDIRDPADPYCVADFRRDTLDLLKAVIGRNKLPVLVGGTMLYFRVLLDGMASMPPTDLAIRERIQQQAREFGWASIHEQLAEVDPHSAKVIHPHHSQRLSRALEVFLSTGETLSSLHARQEAELLPYHFSKLGLIIENRQWLHRRIADRFRCMIDQGLIEEVQALHQRSDLHSDLPAIRAVGYRQVWDYLGGNLSREEMIDRAI
ncbi:MAG: tRNA (adenosine(37)-N6)-dimethylallyltransferase MiaA, partial [Pseudomonadales bacterium]|nr:tRNA (adenosine(37)-N6)-dimethylallyltransferase MiaA [Pseudomonadales bacterium]